MGSGNRSMTRCRRDRHRDNDSTIESNLRRSPPLTRIAGLVREAPRDRESRGEARGDGETAAERYTYREGRCVPGQKGGMAAAFEDVRMTRLRQAMAKTVDGTIGGVTLEEFLGCFPDLAQTHECILAELFAQLNEAVRSNVMVRAHRSARRCRKTVGKRTRVPATRLTLPLGFACRSKSLTKSARRWTW